MRPLATLLGCVLVAACSGSHVSDDVDGGPEPDARPDVLPVLDATIDPPDAEATDADLGVLDPSDDAGPACSCGTPPQCMVARCVDGACVEEPVEDGSACGESDATHCVAGSCVVRGCGDGYREPHGALREGCDDGNLVDGDGCTSECSPTVAFREIEDEDWALVDAAVFDGGEAWIEQERETAMRSLLVRMGAHRVELESPRSWIESPVAARVGDGVVVAWERLDGVALARVTTAGDVLPLTSTGDPSDRSVALAATSEGFVVAWRRDDMVWLREHRGSVRGEPRPIGRDADGEVSLAAAGRDGVVAWESEGRIVARSFSEGVAVGEAQVVADQALDPHAVISGSAHAFAWTSHADDFFGDVLVGLPGSAIAVASSEARERTRGIVPFGPSWAEMHEVGPLASPALAFGADAFVVPELEDVMEALRFADPQTTAIAPARGGLVVAWIGYTGGGPHRQLATFFLPDS